MQRHLGAQNHHVAPKGASHAALAAPRLSDLPPFPKVERRAQAVPPGLALRSARSGDLQFLLRLYGETRTAELSLTPWSEAQKQAFITDQFSLQHLHYVQRNPHADFWLIERIGLDGRHEPIGRLYLDRSEREWRAIDLCLLTKARSAGIGGAVIRSIQKAALETEADSVTLYVEKTNHGARRLYARLGFEEAPSPFPGHCRMRWSP
ncbi:GNAT family N-acetyltransferase [Caulobacter sp. BP25]|uniref:GNAT family N-acetyltransferase n=1 Tax=Caulobacter sp. BP25 TaxID=2048900 RepID=UPI000C12CA7A|nr:GNAT family N-acetyltransferase [Caulobacter sp. BP25]PHY21114.1 GNAT family N-acetyltransferase [Caulobacter sp. BP25]